MTKYFDQKFWKMFSGFITLIAVSVCLVLFAKMYEEKNKTDSQNISENLARTNH